MNKTITKHAAPKARNPMARELASPLYRLRVVKNRRAYTRKGRATQEARHA